MEEQNQTPTSPTAGEPASLKPGMVVPRGALMAVRATLHRALCEYANANSLRLLAVAAGDMAADIQSAHQQIEALLGITEPADEDPYAGDAEGEMQAEAEAERMADAAHEIACEGWTLDPYDGWY